MEMPVRVVTSTTRGAGAAKTIDWKNKSDRKWLTNHLTWAVNNNAEVCIERI